MTKQRLATAVADLLKSRFGSLAEAARSLDIISYERLKKSVQRNSFRADFLTALFPDQSRETLREQYDFRCGRATDNAKTAVRGNARIVRLLHLISAADLEFLHENKLARERVTELIKRECELIRNLFST